MELPDPQLLGKHLLEAEIASAGRAPGVRNAGKNRSDADGVQSMLGGIGAADALRRP